MVSFNPKRFAVFWLIIAGVVAGTGLLLHENAVEAFSLNFVEPKNLKDGDRVVVDVKCYINAITFIKDSKGAIIGASDKSKFLQENPRFDLTATVNSKSAENGFITPRIMAKCQMPTLIDSSGNTKFPIIIERITSTLQYSIVSQSGEEKEKIRSYVSPEIQLPKEVELFHDKETVVYEKDLKINEVLETLEDGTYDSFQQIDWSGYFQMHLKDPDNPPRFAGNKWYIDIPFDKTAESKNEPINELTTWIEIKVNKSTGTKKTGGNGGSGGNEFSPKPPVCNKGDENCESFETQELLQQLFGCGADTNCYLQNQFYGIYAMVIVGGGALWYIDRRTSSAGGINRNE